MGIRVPLEDVIAFANEHGDRWHKLEMDRGTFLKKKHPDEKESKGNGFYSHCTNLLINNTSKNCISDFKSEEKLIFESFLCVFKNKKI